VSVKHQVAHAEGGRGIFLPKQGNCVHQSVGIRVSYKRGFLRHFFCYDGNGDAFTGSEVIVIFTKPYTTDVLTPAQIDFIAGQLPCPKATTARPAYSNQELLPGILRVLRSGCRWRDLNLPGYPDDLSLSRLNHWLPRGQTHPEIMQRTAEIHHQITDALLPQAHPVFHNATALDAAVDMLDPQPSLVERLVG
jgi:hypothetical protein